MSVLNDVLKNLDAQKARQRAVLMHPSEEVMQSLPWYVWGILGFMLAAIVFLGIQVSMLYTQRLDIPLDLYEFDATPTSVGPVSIADQRSKSASALSDPSTDPSTTASIDPPMESYTSTRSAAIAKDSDASSKVVSKTQSTQAQEAAISALKLGETEQVKKILPRTDPAMQHNLNLRLMLKESPENVVPYLQTNTPDFMSNNELLALAAQAQQRAGEHKMAVVYYQRLIKRLPGEARWRAGLAISLDGLGEHQKAMSVYRAVLQSGALPAPLKRFVEYRLKKLESING